MWILGNQRRPGGKLGSAWDGHAKQLLREVFGRHSASFDACLGSPSRRRRNRTGKPRCACRAPRGEGAILLKKYSTWLHALRQRQGSDLGVNSKGGANRRFNRSI